MSQKPDYDRGYRDAVRAAIAWLHRRAAEMNDPHAKSILDSAATHLGWDRAHHPGRLVDPPHPDPTPKAGE